MSKKKRAVPIPSLIDDNEFVRMAHEAFPVLKDEVSPDMELYSNVRELADIANRAMSRADWDSYKELIAFMDQIIRNNPSGNVCNAVSVSFLEDLEFSSNGENGKRAKCMLTTALKKMWDSLDEAGFTR